MSFQNHASLPDFNALRCLRLCILLILTLPPCNLCAGDDTVPTLLAKRGRLLVDDNGSKDRGGRLRADLGNGIVLGAAAGSWKRIEISPNIWRASWNPRMGHSPVASYRGLNLTNFIVEVTFRFGPNTEVWHHQCFRIAADRRPDVTGHILSAWANPNNDFIETGLLLQHIRKTPRKEIIEDLLLDRQHLTLPPDQWHTATLENVDSEALFRVGSHLAYAKSDKLKARKNLISLTLGTTWHEIRRVRIWDANPNADWPANKADVLQVRMPFDPGPHENRPTAQPEQSGKLGK